MRLRYLAVAALATASIGSTSLVLGAVPSSAGEPASKAAHYRTTLRYTFDRGETLRARSLVHDVSGHHNAGRVRVAYHGRLTVEVGKLGHAVRYPAPCVGCRKAIIQARDRSSLDPRRHPFVFGATVKVTPFQARGDSNLVQKGLYNQVGGQYKLQMNNGVPECVIYGGRGRVFATAPTSIATGTRQRLECQRTSRAVILRVNGRVVAKTFHRTGLLANQAPLRVGGYDIIADNDQYHGVLDNVFLRIRF